VEKTNFNALKLAWSFFKGNLKLNLLAILVMFVFTIFSLIPLLGIIFSLLTYLIVFSYQVYIGKHISVFDNEEGIIEFVKNINLSDYLFKYLPISLGAWFGFLLVGVLYFIVFAGLFMLTGSTLNYDIYGNMQLSSTSVIIILFALILFGLLLYIYPAIMGKIFTSNNLGDAFKNVFLFFNIKFWKETFNAKYFLLILIWSIISILGIIIGEVMIFSIILLPIGLIIIYYIGLYSALIYSYSYQIIESNITKNIKNKEVK